MVNVRAITWYLIRRIITTWARVRHEPQHTTKHPTFTGTGRRAGGHGPETTDSGIWSVRDSAGDDVSKYAGSEGLSLSPKGTTPPSPARGLVKLSDEVGASPTSISANSPHSTPLRGNLCYTAQSPLHSSRIPTEIRSDPSKAAEFVRHEGRRS